MKGVMMNGPQATFPELSAEEARRRVDLSTLQFTTTAEFEPLTTLIGQERATQALHMGLVMRQQGYNIFVCGFEGTGAQTQIAALLREREQRELGEKYQQEVRQIQEAFHRVVQEKGFEFQADATGNVAFIRCSMGVPCRQRMSSASPTPSGRTWSATRWRE
jgi:hypothetical protein